MGFGFGGLTVGVDVAVGTEVLVAVGADVGVDVAVEPPPEPEPEPLPESDPTSEPGSRFSLTLGEGDSSVLLLGQPAKPNVATRPIAENPTTRVRLPS